MGLGFVILIGTLAAIFVLGVRILAEYERGVVFRLGRFNGNKIGRLPLADPGRRPDGADQPARDRDGRARAGGDHARQRLAEGECGALLPGAAPREGGDPGRELSLRHLPAGADDAAQRLRPGGARRAAGRAGVDQPAAPGDHRPADRAVGRQGAQRRGEADRSAARDAARDGEAGRSRAREALEGDPRRGRVPGRAAARGGREGARHAGVGAPAPLPPDAGGDRDRAQLDDHLPGADRHLPPVLRDGAKKRGGDGA